MERMTEPMMVQLVKRTTPINPCVHGRMIDDVLTRGKKRTGKVRCLECGEIFVDPYHGQK